MRGRRCGVQRVWMWWYDSAIVGREMGPSESCEIFNWMRLRSEVWLVGDAAVALGVVESVVRWYGEDVRSCDCLSRRVEK